MGYMGAAGSTLTNNSPSLYSLPKPLPSTISVEDSSPMDPTLQGLAHGHAPCASQLPIKGRDGHVTGIVGLALCIA